MRHWLRTLSLVLAIVLGCVVESANAQTDPVRRVKQNTASGDDGLSWANAYDDLQDALDEASDPQNGITEIWVAAGTYIPGTLRTDTFSLLPGVSIYGGFAGIDEDDLSERNPDPETNGTILSGDINAPGNSYHVVTASNISFEGFQMIHLDGFKVTLGRADSTTDEIDQRGGGILCVNGGNVRINNCVIQECGAARAGGGAAAIGSSPAFTLCTFRDNSAMISGIPAGDRLGGGGLSIENGSPDPSDVALVYNCTFEGNVRDVHGGGGTVVGADSRFEI